MGFTAREFRAIYFVARRHGWNLSLCVRPYVYYHVPTANDDCTERMRISEVLEEYDEAKKEEQRARKQRTIS